MLKAIIFDIDGTLIDSVDFHAKAWVEALGHFGYSVEYDAVRAQIGKGGDKLLPTFLHADKVKEEGDAIEKFRSELFKEQFLQELRPFSGVRTLFKRLIGDGIEVALASSAKQDELEVYKHIAEIDDLLLAETSSDDADESKPSPDIFNAAQTRLNGIGRTEILVVGDSPYDAVGAKKAGLGCVGVLCGGFSATVLKRAGCKAIFQSPSHILLNYLKLVRF